MATNYTIPFKTGEEIKNSLSQLDIEFDIENVKTSFEKAAADIKDIIGSDMYLLMINHFNSDHFGTGEDYLLLDKLVKHIQDPLANFGMFHHFIWLILRISNNSVTVHKTDKETTAYKYLTDEAKEKLIDSAWMYINSLVDFMNSNATAFTVWVKNTEYALNQIIRYNGTFYKCTAAHTSGETFDETKFTEEDNANVKFYQWTLSDEYAEMQNQVFTGYKDFQKYFDIDSSAYFYNKIRNLISRVQDDEVDPRVFEKSISETFNRKLKRAVAYRVMAIATFELDYFNLPSGIRRNITSEMVQHARFRDVDFVKEKLSKLYDQKADDYFYQLEREMDMIQEKKEIDETGSAEATQPYEHENSEDKPYASML
jgi:hypothetical protein